MSQWAVAGPPTPSFVRLHCYSSPSYLWVWSGGRWVEGEQSTAKPPPPQRSNYLGSFHPCLTTPTDSLCKGRLCFHWGHREGFLTGSVFLNHVMCSCQSHHPEAWVFMVSSSRTSSSSLHFEIDLAERSSLTGKALGKIVAAFLPHIPG